MGARALRTSDPVNEPDTCFMFHWDIELWNSSCMTAIDSPWNNATPRRVPMHQQDPPLPSLPSSIPNRTTTPNHRNHQHSHRINRYSLTLPKPHLRRQQRPLRQPRQIPQLVRLQLDRRRLLRRATATLPQRNNAAPKPRIRIPPTRRLEKRSQYPVSDNTKEIRR